jgi:ABC-2 type transport system ATP-binding protein
VNIFGHDLDKTPAALKRSIGVVPQEFNFNQFEKTFDIVVTQAGYYGIPAKIAKERAEQYLTQLGCGTSARAVPFAVRWHEAPVDDRPRPGA